MFAVIHEGARWTAKSRVKPQELIDAGYTHIPDASSSGLWDVYRSKGGLSVILDADDSSSLGRFVISSYR
jgi:hypothetical protein